MYWWYCSDLWNNYTCVLLTVPISVYPQIQFFHFFQKQTRVKTAFGIHSDTQTGLNNLQKTSTVVKTVWAYKNFTVPPHWRKLPDTQPGVNKLHKFNTMVKQLSTSFLTPKLTHTSFFTILEALLSSCTPLWESGEPWKKYSPLWRYRESFHASLSIRKHPKSKIYYCGGPVTTFRFFSDTQTGMN